MNRAGFLGGAIFGCVLGLGMLAHAALGGTTGVVIPYHGHLDLDGNPVSGLVKLSFDIVNVDTGVDPTAYHFVPAADTPVSGGQFSVLITGVPEAKVTGQAVYVEVSITPPTGPVVTLAGRQRIYPVLAALTSGPGDFAVQGTLNAGAVTTSGTVNAGAVTTAGTLNAGGVTTSGTVTAGGVTTSGSLNGTNVNASNAQFTNFLGVPHVVNAGNPQDSPFLISRNGGTNILWVRTFSAGGSYNLELFEGQAYKPGGGSWGVVSDRRLKKNIAPLNGALERLLKLRSVTFEYKDPEKVHQFKGTQTGFIAQDVEQVFPEWVTENAEGYKTVSIRGFESESVQAIRELRQEKDAQIAALRQELAALRNLVSPQVAASCAH
jgi:hypothetical protein